MSSNLAKSYHSITFGSYNTYDRWHLVPESRPVVVMPEQKKEVVDVPGGNGVLDMSMALTKFPIFNRRSGSIKFKVLNDYPRNGTDFTSWKDIYEELASYLHGQKLNMTLDDDPDFYYSGYYSVTWTSNNDGSGSDVEIGYDLEPYKFAKTITYYTEGSTDTFTLKKSSTASQGTKTINLSTGGLATMPTSLIIVASSASSNVKLNVGFVNTRLSINDILKTNSSGTYVPSYLITSNGTYTIKKFPVCSAVNVNSSNNTVILDVNSMSPSNGDTIAVKIGFRRALL